jgi:hypothetical protein
MGEVVDLKPTPLVDDQELIIDCCRFAEGLLTEKQVLKRHRLAESVWESLSENDELVEKIEAEKLRRIRDGSTKREKSQQLITKAPGILDSIMSDPAASPRHRVDAIKTLDTFAANGPEAATAGTRFLIQINLGSDTLTFNKSIRPLEPGEIDPDDSSPDVDAGVIATKKSQDGGNGNAI